MTASAKGLAVIFRPNIPAAKNYPSMCAAFQKEKPTLVAISGSRQFMIVPDNPEIGFYLYVFEGEKCTHDYLQDTEEKARECAKDLFGISPASWKSCIA